MNLEAIRTRYVRGRLPSFVDKRRKRIEEALKWSGGTQDNPNKHLVSNLSDETEVYFLKPGKEAVRENPNPYDMTPFVGEMEKRLNFAEIWSDLSRIALFDFDCFKVALTLVYRDAYMLDHVEVDKSIRLLPSPKVMNIINEIDEKINPELSLSLEKILHFLDVLGWNEDVKYHVENGQPTFDGRFNFKVGRINTLLTCISVSFQGSVFVEHVIQNNSSKNKIDLMSLYIIMQQMAKSRGTCSPTKTSLLNWLSPHIVE